MRQFILNNGDIMTNIETLASQIIEAQGQPVMEALAVEVKKQREELFKNTVIELSVETGEFFSDFGDFSVADILGDYTKAKEEAVKAEEVKQEKADAHKTNRLEFLNGTINTVVDSVFQLGEGFDVNKIRQTPNLYMEADDNVAKAIESFYSAAKTFIESKGSLIGQPLVDAKKPVQQAYATMVHTVKASGHTYS